MNIKQHNVIVNVIIKTTIINRTNLFPKNMVSLNCFKYLLKGFLFSDEYLNPILYVIKHE